MFKYSKVTSHLATINKPSGETIDLPLEYEPVEWIDPLVHFGDDEITLVYAVSDNHPFNPKEDTSDTFIDAYNGCSSDKEALYKVVGFNQYGDRDYDAIINHHEEEVERRYVALVMERYTEQELLEQFDAVDLDEVKNALINEVGSSHQTYDATYDRVLEQMWKEPEHFPGNVNAVLLDVYSHSGQIWSITGGGMRCQWDTSVGAGAWVPSEETVKYAEEAAKTRAHFRVRKQRTNYILERKVWKDDNWTAEPVETEDSPHLLWRKADKLAEPLTCTEDQLLHGKRCILEDYAEGFLKTYNAHISGDVYGVVVQTYDLDGEPIEDEACWGCYTSDYTKFIMQEELDAATKD